MIRVDDVLIIDNLSGLYIAVVTDFDFMINGKVGATVDNGLSEKAIWGPCNWGDEDTEITNLGAL